MVSKRRRVAESSTAVCAEGTGAVMYGKGAALGKGGLLGKRH